MCFWKRVRGPRISKDGVTVAKELELKDKFENMGVRLVREVASKTSDVAGDGTTTATVLAQAIVKEGVKSLAAGANPMDLKRGIDLAVQRVVDEVHAKSKQITSNDESPSCHRLRQWRRRDRPHDCRSHGESRPGRRDHR